MALQPICEHMNACPEGPCSVGPCTECGALCPNSSWTPDYAQQEAERVIQEAHENQKRTESLIALYEDRVKA